MVLSSFASQLANGSPVLAGVFRGVKVDEFPARLDPFYIAMEIEADPHENGEHIFELRMIDEDGVTLYDNEIQAQFDQRPDYLPTYMYFCGQVFVQGVVQKAGVCRFDLVWNDQVIAQARLEVTT